MICRNSWFGIVILILSGVSACGVELDSGTKSPKTSPVKSETDYSSDNGTDAAKTNGHIQSDKTGTYEMKDGTSNNEFLVKGLSGDRLKIEFNGSYEYEVDGEPMANTGTANGIASVKGNTASFTPEDMEDCSMTLIFKGNTLEVKDNGECTFGLNVGAPGVYKKVNDKPVFEDDDDLSKQ